MVDLNPNTLIIILNVNGLKNQLKTEIEKMGRLVLVEHDPIMHYLWESYFKYNNVSTLEKKGKKNK